MICLLLRWPGRKRRYLMSVWCFVGASTYKKGDLTLHDNWLWRGISLLWRVLKQHGVHIGVSACGQLYIIARLSGVCGDICAYWMYPEDKIGKASWVFGALRYPGDSGLSLSTKRMVLLHGFGGTAVQCRVIGHKRTYQPSGSRDI